MNEDLASWSIRLIFASMCVLLGLAGFMAGRSSADRQMTFGLFVQGICLTFVAGSVYLGHSPELRMGALVVAGLLIIFSLAGSQDSEEEQSKVEDRCS